MVMVFGGELKLNQNYVTPLPPGMIMAREEVDAGSTLDDEKLTT